MNDDDTDYECTCNGTVLTFEYGEIVARVTIGQNLSPDYVDTILGDLRKQVIAGARQVGMVYEPSRPVAADGDG